MSKPPLATVTDNVAVADIHDHLATRNLLPTHHIVERSGYMDAQGWWPPRPSMRSTWSGRCSRIRIGRPARTAGMPPPTSRSTGPTTRSCCPQGHRSSYWRAHHDHTGHDVVEVRWSWTICKRCPVLGACSQKQQGSRTLKLRAEAEYRALQPARQRQTTPAFREQYAQRAGIEGTLSQCIRRVGYGVRGIAGSARPTSSNSVSPRHATWCVPWTGHPASQAETTTVSVLGVPRRSIAPRAFANTIMSGRAHLDLLRRRVVRGGLSRPRLGTSDAGYGVLFSPGASIRAAPPGPGALPAAHQMIV